MIDREGLGFEIADPDCAPFRELVKLDLEPERGRAPLMHDAKRPLIRVGLENAPHMPDHARRRMHDERARATLVPARDEKLIEIDDVVGMVMRDDERIDVGAALACRDEPLRDTRAAIDEEARGRAGHEMRRPGAHRRGDRAAGAEKGEIISRLALSALATEARQAPSTDASAFSHLSCAVCVTNSRKGERT